MAEITIREIGERLDAIEALVLELLRTSQKGALSVEEAADYISIGKRSLYTLMGRDPDFPDFKPAGLSRRIIPKVALDRWLAENVGKGG